MRIDGSIKTITAGVSTMDSKVHDGSFAEIVDNFRCEPDKGLTRRPGLAWTNGRPNYLAGFEHGTFSAVISNTPYWVTVKRPTAPDGTYRVGLVNSNTGELFTINGVDSYFDSMDGVDDLAWTVINDVVYIANKNMVVQTLPETEDWTKTSMVVVKVAPKAFSKITVSWVTSANIPLSIVYDVPDDAAIGKSAGTNTTAEEIFNLMTAAA
jgi:hypothetical protein